MERNHFGSMFTPEDATKEVLAYFPLPGGGGQVPGAIVLCHWPESEDPYVTWEMSDAGYCYWGHYFSDYEEARKDFAVRVGRGY